MMECPRHGLKRPSFICRHLQYGKQYGKKLGFNQPDELPNPDWPFENAWCDKCNQFLRKEGEWNDKSEGFAGIVAICEGCFKEIKRRNER